MRALLPLLLVALVMAGCATAGATDPTGADRTGTALDWGLAGIADVPTLDPALASDPTSIAVSSLLYGGLVRLDHHLRVQPDAASRWTISRDGKVYTFRLRPNLRYADGRAVSAVDIVRSLDRALGPAGASGPAPLYLGLVARSRGVPAIEALNRRTVRIALTRPAAHFLAALAFPTSFVPDPRVIARYGATWTNHARGFGPYRVISWQHTQTLTLAPNPYYWARRPPFGRIRIHMYPATSSALAAYRRGTVDVVSGFAPGEPLQSRLPGQQAIPALALDYMAFNTTRPPFDRPAPRLALARVARDIRPARVLGGGAALPARGVLTGAFGVPQPPWPTPAAAPRLLARGGYPRGRGFPPIVLIIPRDAGMIALGRTLVRAWRSTLQIKARVQALNPSNYTAVLTRRAFDVAIVRWGGDYPDPQDFLGTQLGASPNNVTGWSPSAYGRLVTLADSYSPIDPRRARLFRAAVALIQVGAPLAPLDEPAIPALIRPSLHGVTMTGLGAISIGAGR